MQNNPHGVESNGNMMELPEREPANLLVIYDLSLDGQHDAQCVREAKDCDNLEGALQDLPDQGDCCRLYIVGNLASKERVTLEDHLQRILPLYNSFSRKGFNSLSTQWATTKPSLHHALDLITADTGKEVTKLAPIPVTCSIGCHRAVNSALVRPIVLKVPTKSFPLGYQLNDRRRKTSRHRREVFRRYINVFLDENQKHRHCQRNEQNSGLRSQVYLLQFYRTALTLHEDFSEHAERTCRANASILLGPALETHDWAETVKDASCYNIYLETSNSISLMARSLVNFVRETCTEKDLVPEIKCLLTEVELLSAGVASPFAWLANRSARQMDMINTSRNIQDSRDSRLLNLLACIFLPASLATSLLSMSTRFVDLGPLLYDFCGVMILFASFVALIFSLLKVYQWAKKELATELGTRDWNKYHGPLTYVQWWKMLLSLLLAMVWATVLSSFVVGMVMDVSLGSRILGYGTAVALALTLILVAVGRKKWVETDSRDLWEVVLGDS